MKFRSRRKTFANGFHPHPFTRKGWRVSDQTLYTTASTILNSTFNNNIATVNNGATKGSASGGSICCNSTIAASDLTISGSIFLANATVATDSNYGGAIYITTGNADQITVNVINSTFYGNSVTSTNGKFVQGGAIFQTNNNNGGALSTLSIYNSTIVANSASSTNGTRGRGAGVSLSKGTLIIESTIIGDNTVSGSAPDLLYNTGALTVTNSLIETADGHSFTDGVDSNIVGHDGRLDILADNGGPTQTVALLAGSLAIDAGSNSLNLTTDQRGVGFNRSSGSGVDMGAFETASAVEVFVDWASNSGLNGGNEVYDADPDGDGVVNLLEYLIDCDPLSSETMGLAPSIDGGNQLGITYQSDRAVEPTDLGTVLK